MGTMQTVKALGLMAAMALPTGAGAATIIYGDDSFGGFLVKGPGSTPATLTFQVDEAAGIDIGNITFSASGSSAGSDLSAISIAFDRSSTAANPDQSGLSFTLFPGSGTSRSASFDFSPTTGYADGETFTFTFSGTTAKNVFITYSFDTTLIPVPAAGAMLGLALLMGAGVAARRRRD